MRPNFQYTKIPTLSKGLGLLFPFQRCQVSSSRRNCAPRMTTVHKGTAFEERSLQLLKQSMSMSLKRVGGKEDGGIDLVGWWWLPHDITDASKQPSSSFNRRRIRVVGQCKAEKKKLGPNYVRELEGVLYRFLTIPSTITSIFPPTENVFEPWSSVTQEHSSFPMVALLISESPFTKSTLLRAHSSSIPFFLLHLPPLEEISCQGSHANDNADDSMGSLGAAVCNPALGGSQGLLKGQMEVRWERHFMGQEGRPAIWWNNKKLPSKVPDTRLPGVSEKVSTEDQGKNP